ncbi:MAG: hypothetical protein GXP49_02755 [Deltaproteobacteria bacterium]|nr:hypothetical protein [Deltaproteobacteria bacterium]
MSDEEHEVLTFELGTILDLHCQKCSRVTKNEVIFEKNGLHHMKCRSCMDIRVCEFEDSHRNPKLLTFKDILERKQQDERIPYRADAFFETGMLIEHSTLGTGYILALYEPDPKMYVMFEDENKVLVNAKRPK